MRILIVEDEARITANIGEVLSGLKYPVDIVGSGEEALFKAETEDYDVIILDWMLPDINGNVICDRLRKTGISTPILFLTAKGQLADKVQGLQAGADDYLTKPFAMEELVERIKALIRRKDGASQSPTLKIADLTLDTNKREVARGGKVIGLAPREYLILEYLMLNKDKALDRSDILSHVWGDDVDSFSNTVDVHIRYLRRKIDDPYKLKLIKTVKAKGYMLCED